MVFSQAAAETALVLPAHLELHLDDFTTALVGDDELHAVVPGLDWLHSAMPDDHEFLDRLSPSQQDEEWDRVLMANQFDAEFCSTTSGSGLSSPIDSPAFDVDALFDEVISSPIKRKAQDYDSDGDDEDDDDIVAKKAKVKKVAAASAPIKARRTHDETTTRTIALLRAQNVDNPESRRRIHNVLERKRRNDLKFSYQELRESIPELETADRAPTGQILAKAVDFIAHLQSEEQRMAAAIAAMKAENERLRAQLTMV